MTFSMEEDGFLLVGVASEGSGAAGGADELEAGDEVRRSTNDGVADGVAVAQRAAAPLREVTPVEESVEELTLEVFLCGRKEESRIKNLKERQEMLCQLAADGMPERLFSPEYLDANVGGITALLEAIRRSSKRKRDWNKATVVDQLVKLYRFMMADSEKGKDPEIASTFLEFMRNAATRVKDENAAAHLRRNEEAAKASQPPPPKKRKDAMRPGAIPQLSYTWDPSKKDPVACPRCNHMTVMNVEVEGGQPSRKQIKEYREKMATWNLLPRRDRANEPKPVMAGTIVQQKICMCCVMSCTNGSMSCPHCKEHPPTFTLSGVCHCAQCRCQCQLVFDAHSRFAIAQEAFNAAMGEQEIEIQEDPIEEVGQVVRGYIRSSNLTLGVDPENEASYANHQDSMALAAHAMDRDVGLHTNAALRFRAQRHLGEAPRAIRINGRDIPVSHVTQTRNGEFLIAGDEPLTGGNGTRDPQLYCMQTSGPPMVDTSNHRSRHNGLSNQAVDDMAKLTGGLTSASTNKNRCTTKYQTPAYALPRAAPAAVSRTAVPQVARAAAAAEEVDLTDSPVQANFLTYSAESTALGAAASLDSRSQASALLRQVQARLVLNMADQSSRRLYRALMGDQESWTRNVEIFLDSRGGISTATPDDELLESLANFLMQVHSSPTK